MNAKEVIKARRSVRTYNGQPLPTELRNKLMEGTGTVSNPFGVPVRFVFLDHAGKDSAYRLGTKGVVTGTETYVAAAVERNLPHAMEAFGYEFEKFVLHATELGIGTAILAATIERDAFEQAIHLGPDEMMPTITPVGYPSEKPSIRESLMRKGMKADERKPFEELFFDGNFLTPLTSTAAGDFFEALELLRWAPSATNAQPWLVVKDGRTFHFFRRQKPDTRPTAASEIQKMDLGIAMSHFDLVRQEAGIIGNWCDLSGSLTFPVLSSTDYLYSFVAV